MTGASQRIDGCDQSTKGYRHRSRELGSALGPSFPGANGALRSDLETEVRAARARMTAESGGNSEWILPVLRTATAGTLIAKVLFAAVAGILLALPVAALYEFAIRDRKWRSGRETANR